MTDNDIRLQELQVIFGPNTREARDGQELLVQCPFCVSRGMGKPDTKGHLGLNFGINKAHCVRCGYGNANLRSFLRTQGYSIGNSSLKALGTSLRNQLVAKISKLPPEYQDQQLETPAEWVPITKAPAEYFRSLQEKGLTKDICKRWDIMACVDGPQEGYVIFKFMEFDQLVYWQGRAAWISLIRKYSPPLLLGASNWVYNYPIDNSHVFGRTIILTEGTLDCISASEVLRGTKHEDHYWALSLQGTSMSKPGDNRHWLNSQLGKLRSLKPKRVLVLLDPEERRKADRLVLTLQDDGIPSERVTYQHGMDPNELFRTNPRYLLDLLTDNLRSKCTKV